MNGFRLGSTSFILSEELRPFKVLFFTLFMIQTRSCKKVLAYVFSGIRNISGLEIKSNHFLHLLPGWMNKLTVLSFITSAKQVKSTMHLRFPQFVFVLCFLTSCYYDFVALYLRKQIFNVPTFITFALLSPGFRYSVPTIRRFRPIFFPLYFFFSRFQVIGT